LAGDVDVLNVGIGLVVELRRQPSTTYCGGTRSPRRWPDLSGQGAAG